MRRWIWLPLAIGLLGGEASAQSLHVLTTIPTSWRQKPTGDQMAAAFPRKARDAGLSGWGIIECQTDMQGDLKACQVLGESPANQGFGQAALDLARYFRLDVAKIDSGQLAGGVVTIPLIFNTNNTSAPLTNALAGSPALLLTPDAKGPTPCPAPDAPQRTCRVRKFSWAARPTLVETAPLVRAAAAEPATTAVLCSIAQDMRLTACDQASPSDPSQREAMNGLLPRFTVPVEAEDRTSTRDGLIFVEFDWPALKRAVETSVLTRTP